MDEDLSQPGRSQLLTALAVITAWQFYVVAAAYFHAAEFRRLFQGLGAELPPITRVFFATYRGWVLFPLVFLALIVDLARRRRAPGWYSAVLIAASLAVGFTLQAWANEACFAPMFSLIKQIG
jgi:hypothetical protein